MIAQQIDLESYLDMAEHATPDLFSSTDNNLYIYPPIIWHQTSVMATCVMVCVCVCDMVCVIVCV